MIVPVEILKCVGFVGGNFGGVAPEVKGTCFFIGKVSKRIPDWGWTYAVTARHVIDNIAHKGGEVMLRLNVSAHTSDWVPCPNPWKTHHDPTVDVAIMEFDLVAPLDHHFYPIDSRVGHPSISHIWQPDIGDEVFFPGLFAGHYGKKRNEPIVRTGHIAAMPKEKVTANFAPGVHREIDAFLLEARSIGGFSGSPVFYYTGSATRSGGMTMGGTRFFLMGVIQGHYDVRDISTDAISLDEAKINMGIGIAVPVEKIVETLEQYAGAELEQEEQELQRRGASTADTGSGDQSV